jgi:hypothetical protein
MNLVPAYCRSCSHFYLESLLVVAANNALCECGGIARVLPGARYTADDETLFDAVVSSLRNAGITWMAAPQLARALDGRTAEPPGAALTRLARLVPSLSIIELIAGGDPRTARTAEAMFATVLDAIAATRSHSDTAPRPLEHLGSKSVAARKPGRR